MRLLTRISLQWKILLLVGLGMVILVSIFGLLGMNALRETTRDALSNRLVLAQVAASRLDLVLGYSLGLMERSAMLYPINPTQVNSTDPGAVSRFLGSTRGGLPLTVSYLALVNQQGLIVGVDPEASLAQGSPAPGQDRVCAVLATGKAEVTSLVLDEEASGLVYLLAPLRDEQGQVAGLLQAAIDPTDSNLGEFVPPLGLGQTGYVEVVDGNGTVLASDNPGGLLRKEDHGDRFASLIAEGSTTTGTCHSCHQASSGGQNRQRTVLAFAPMARAPWGVAIGQSETEALAATNRLKRQLLFTGILALALAAPLTWVGSRRLLHPLRVLTQASHRIADGDLDSPYRGWVRMRSQS